MLIKYIGFTRNKVLIYFIVLYKNMYTTTSISFTLKTSYYLFAHITSDIGK